MRSNDRERIQLLADGLILRYGFDSQIAAQAILVKALALEADRPAERLHLRLFGAAAGLPRATNEAKRHFERHLTKARRLLARGGEDNCVRALDIAAALYQGAAYTRGSPQSVRSALLAGKACLALNNGQEREWLAIADGSSVSQQKHTKYQIGTLLE
jgi:hypothetical protein